MNINWNQLVKYLSDSKPITAAAFITSLIFVLGYRYEFDLIPKLSDSIYIYVFGMSIFSGSLLTISLLSVIYGKTNDKIDSFRKKRNQNNLSDLEKKIIIEFRDVGSEVIHSNRIIEKYPNITKIEVMNSVTSLESKGLLKVAYDRNYFWIEKGHEDLVMKLASTDENA